MSFNSRMKVYLKWNVHEKGHGNRQKQSLEPCFEGWSFIKRSKHQAVIPSSDSSLSILQINVQTD